MEDDRSLFVQDSSPTSLAKVWKRRRLAPKAGMTQSDKPQKQAQRVRPSKRSKTQAEFHELERVIDARDKSLPPQPQPPLPAYMGQESLDFSETQPVITIRVTSIVNETIPEQNIDKDFTVHLRLLIAHSVHFARLLSSGEVGNSITLKDVRHETFAILVNWLYSQKIVHEGPNMRLMELNRVWELGERFEMPVLQNCLMDQVVRTLKTVNSFPLFIAFAYADENAKSREVLRRLVVARLQTVSTDRFQNMIQHMPDALKTDLMLGMKSHADSLAEMDKYKMPSSLRFYVLAPIVLD